MSRAVAKLFFLTLVVVVLITSSSFASTQSQLARGKYIFQLAGCNSCHTDKTKKDQLLAGGPSIKTPFGIFFGPNITPDKTYGIGDWSDEDFFKAMQKGVGPDGSQYYPVFPYTSYTKMTRQDLKDLKVYIYSLPPISRENKAHQITFPVNLRLFQLFWKFLFFDEGSYVYRQSNGNLWNRGAYLVNAITHCGECHTPRNIFGGSMHEWFLSGKHGAYNVEQTPNITSDLKTGIGKWSTADLEDTLKFGVLPDGDTVGGSMAEVVENLSEIRSIDLQAIISFLQSVPGISHRTRNTR